MALAESLGEKSVCCGPAAGANWLRTASNLADFFRDVVKGGFVAAGGGLAGCLTGFRALLSTAVKLGPGDLADLISTFPVPPCAAVSILSVFGWGIW